MKYCLLILFLLSVISCSHSPKECVIIGEVIDRSDLKTINLYTSDGNPNDSAFTPIPVSAGKFTITLPADQAELMRFMVEDDERKGVYRFFNFFKEADTVTIQLRFKSPINAENSTVEGGPLQKRYEYLTRESQKLFPTDSVIAALENLERNNLYHTDEANKVYKQLVTCKTGSTRDSLYKVLNTIEKYTPAYVALLDSLDNIRYNSRTKWLADEATKNVTEADLAIMWQLFIDAIMHDQKVKNLDQLVEIYKQQYSKKFCNNPMGKKVDELLCSWENIKVGGNYIDFEAPNMADSTTIIKLSDQIKGKVAVIDMWSSWCSPCIRISKSLIPVYEKYKNDGFTVVSVARETASASAAKATIDRCKFPWINLIELNNTNRIWHKYGMSNVAGRVFLIDKNGKILFIDPSAEEIEQKLSEIL